MHTMLEWAIYVKIEPQVQVEPKQRVNLTDSTQDMGKLRTHMKGREIEEY